MDWLRDRLNEPSTVRGVIIVAVAVCIMYFPDAARVLIIVGAIAYGATEVIRRERGK